VTQIKKSGIKNDAIDGTKIKLANNESVRSRNNANSADLPILKVNTSDLVEFGTKPQSTFTPTLDNDLATVKSARDYADTKQALSQKGQPNGYAPLDGAGLIASAFLPSYVDDVLEYASFSVLPAIGEAGKIYVTLDTNLTYRWTGSTYIKVGQEVTQVDLTNSANSTLATANLNSIINALIFG